MLICQNPKRMLCGDQSLQPFAEHGRDGAKEQEKENTPTHEAAHEFLEREKYCTFQLTSSLNSSLTGQVPNWTGSNWTFFIAVFLQSISDLDPKAQSLFYLDRMKKVIFQTDLIPDQIPNVFLNAPGIRTSVFIILQLLRSIPSLYK